MARAWSHRRMLQSNRGSLGISLSLLPVSAKFSLMKLKDWTQTFQQHLVNQVYLSMFFSQTLWTTHANNFSSCCHILSKSTHLHSERYSNYCESVSMWYNCIDRDIWPSWANKQLWSVRLGWDHSDNLVTKFYQLYGEVVSFHDTPCESSRHTLMIFLDLKAAEATQWVSASSWATYIGRPYFKTTVTTTSEKQDHEA